jgi:hypothetical protein
MKNFMLQTVIVRISDVKARCFNVARFYATSEMHRNGSQGCIIIDL